MTHEALLAVLSRISAEPVDQYLQAVVASSQCSNVISFVHDGRWATLLIQTAQELTSLTSPHSAVYAILSKWCSPSLPVEPTLYLRAIDITIRLLHRVDDSLAISRLWEDWTAAIPYASVLSRLQARPEGISTALEELLGPNIPRWHSWACWRPHGDRILRWQALWHEKHMRALWTLLGPDPESLGGTCREISPSAPAYHITNGTFNHWLKTNGLTPGPRLLDADAKELRRFSDDLFCAVDGICSDGPIGTEALFFEHVCMDKQLGLDDHALHLMKLCKDAISEEAQAFLMMVLQREDAPLAPRCLTSTIIKGLRILDKDAYAELRTYLKDDIMTQVYRATDSLRNQYLDWVGHDQALQSAHANAISSFQLALTPSSSWLQGAELRETSFDAEHGIWLKSLYTFSALYKAIVADNGTLEVLATKYIRDFVFGNDTTGDEELALMHHLHALWVRTTSSSKRSAALSLAGAQDTPLVARTGCIIDLALLQEASARALSACITRSTDSSASDVCRQAMALAADAVQQPGSHKDCWRSLVRYVMGMYRLSPQYVLQLRTFTDCAVSTYEHWIWNLYRVFDDTISHLDAALAWTQRLSAYSRTLDDLHAMPNSNQSIRCIYTAFDRVQSETVFQALSCVKQESREERRTAMLHILQCLTNTHAYAGTTLAGVQLIKEASHSCFEQCCKLIDLSLTQSLYVAAVQLNVWLATTVLDQSTTKALQCLAVALHLPPTAKADLAKDYFLRRVADLMKGAAELDATRAQLKRTDKSGVAALLLKLKIEDTTSTTDDENLSLPDDIINMVEQVDERTLELSFSTAHLKLLQRKAMGLTASESIIVRITRAPSGSWESFCVHVCDPQTDWHSIKHNPMKLSQSTPHRLPCEGRDTRIGYAIMRSDWRWLVSTHSTRGTSVGVIYRNIERAIKLFGNHCIVCDQSLQADLYRPTLCAANGCWAIWIQSSLEVRLADVRLDEPVVELLLAAVQASVTWMSIKGTLDLLPTRPARLNQNAPLLDLMNKIPSIATAVKSLDDLYQIKSKYSLRGELLLSWLCNGYKGVLASANSGPLRIPNLPNVLQFVMVDSPPPIAAAFAKHDHLQPRQVLFHGTSMDRLWPILCQGLKVLSSTSFQTHGAAHGSGIYLAENPSTAVGYASQAPCQQPTFAAQHSAYVNKKVLLGIEYAGNDASRGNGIHVATDPTKLLLRYIFLLPEGFRAPIANHVVPAMLSNISTLRSGVRKT